MLLRWLFRILAVILLLWLLPYSWTLILAMITAILLDGLVSFLQDRLKWKRGTSVLVSFLIYIGGLAGLGYIFVSVIIQQIITLSETFPSFIKEIFYSVILPSIRKWENYAQTLPKDVILSVEDMMEKGIQSLEAFFRSLIESIVQLATILPGFFIEFLIYLIALFLFSLELPGIKRSIKNLFQEKTYEKVSFVYNELMMAGWGFVKSQVILSLITFIMAYSGLLILKVPYTLLLSMLIVIVDILPILGTGSVLVPWAVVVILQGNQNLGIGLIALFFIITVVRRIVEPKIYSANMGVSPLAALVSLYLGFKVLGFAGLFIGPALVIVYEALKKAGVIKIKTAI
ncbi:sporulation integral membrane protein YtvI [Peribacillus alkalitolerans]|uniref:sporulation integral membrane protein YtvI n=1 Tax=Peribacillus alkalitolerans TaxID=1550385 RepID=UPI0013CF5920|nr:sporulation integral membrane protein YtvI [Peribacillus alkalitolerans]